MKCIRWFLILTVAITVGLRFVENDRPNINAAQQQTETLRISKGLVALYEFTSTSGSIVKDRSGAGAPLDLKIDNLKAVRRGKGTLEIHGKTILRAEKNSSRLIRTIKKSGEITLEAWLRPANTKQNGPARIVTLSNNPNERNFTLGQEGDQYDVRFRTTRTSKNGLPSVSSSRRSVTTKITHVVYTRDRSGRSKLFVNGKQVGVREVNGSHSNWDDSHHFALANELSGDRPWQGTFYLVAIYDRDLSVKEIQRNLKAGPGAASEAVVSLEKQHEESKRLFESKVVSILTKKCIECHGGKSTRGRLDLASKIAAMNGGKSGRVIRPHDSGDSELWKLVQSNEMPKDRPPLTVREKNVLRQWIDTGAIWTVEKIRALGIDPETKTATNWIRRLTVDEYVETVRVAVGVDIEKEARKILPRDLRADGFSNTAYNLGVDLAHVEAHSKLAALIVRRVDVLKHASQFTESEKLSNENLHTLISGMGKWILRGPLQEREINAFLDIAKAVQKEGGDFKEVVSFILEGMLQSPRFIYRIENQQDKGKAKLVGNYELASRLSYALWGAPPDRKLMLAADSGKLADKAKVLEQVQRMLKDPRAISRSARFVHEWLNLDRLDYVKPDKKKFPKWDPQLAQDMREETLAFFKDVTWKQNRPLSDLFTAQFTYATPRLAQHYGLKSKGEGLTKYDLSSVPGRGGLLTHGGILTIGGDEASMVARGLFVLHDLLDDEVGDPPPCVDTTPIPTKPGMSQRGIALVRLGNASCTGCHSRFEPLAFGLEKFDGVGAYHEVDRHGNRLREDGEILFPGTKKPVAYKTSAEMMQLLAKSDRVKECIARKVTQWVMGRPLVQADEPILAKIHEQAQKNGGTYSSLITAIVMSDLVQMTRTE